MASSDGKEFAGEPVSKMDGSREMRRTAGFQQQDVGVELEVSTGWQRMARRR
jgi:hypothetical protein